MKVCLITGEYPPLQGGVGDYTSQLATALADWGTEVHVLTDARCRNEATERSGSARQGRVTVYPVVARWGWDSWPAIRGVLRRVQPEIVHIQYQAAAYAMHPLANLLPWLLRRDRATTQGRPYILATFHDLLVPYLFPKAGPLRWQAILALARGSDAVIVTNREDERRLSAYPWIRSLSVIPIGSNIAVQPPPGYNRWAWRAHLGVQDDDILLCYFGFLNEAKGGETLVRALGMLCDQDPKSAIRNPQSKIRLLMVGGQVGDSDPTNKAYLEKVKALIAELGLTERVLWTGFTPPPEVSAHLLAADIAVLPYRQGANLRHGSLHACLTHGLPIVSTEDGVRGTEEMGRWGDGAVGRFPLSPHLPIPPSLTDGVNVRLVTPDAPAALAQAVAALVASPEERERLGQGARELAQQFTWESIAARHLAVYRNGLAPLPYEMA